MPTANRSPRHRRVLALAALVLLGGCGAERGTPSAPATISGTPAESAQYSARHQATIAVENGDGLAAVAGAVWVKTDDGRVVRIDPRTNRVTDRIRVDTTSDKTQYCQGIGTDGESVWACIATDEGTGVAQIDPATRRIVRRVPVGKVFDQLVLPATSRGIWVLTADGARASVVDPASGHVTGHRLGARCLQLAAGDGLVVATCATANRVLALDAASGKVAARASLSSPRWAVVAGGSVWVDTDRGLTRLTRDLTVRAVYPDLIAGTGGDLAAAAGSVWLRATDGTITRIDARTGRVLQRITSDRPLTPGSLLVAFGSLWTTSGDQGSLVRLAA